MAQLHVQRWGSGEPVVLVHGSLSGGDESWEDQRALGARGFALLVPDRQCYGGSPDPGGEDYLRDAEDLAELFSSVGRSVHVVGHSYGSVGAMIAAARSPEAVRSLVLVEPPAYELAADDPAVAEMVEAHQRLWAQEGLSDRDFLERFLPTIGVDASSLPSGLLDRMAAGVPQMRQGRRVWDADLPVASLASAGFPVVVVSGGHSPAFEAMASAVAAAAGARQVTIKGNGHEVQGTGSDFNEFLVAFWESVAEA